MSIHHSFDIEHARLFGLPEAVLISNLQFWISKNAANGVHQHEGRTWTYNSAKAFALLFPYLSDRQIRRTIDSLTDQAVVMKGNYNTSACDRTMWLAFVDEDSFLVVKKPAPKSANGSPKKSKPAPVPANGCAEKGKSLIEQIVNTDSKQGEGSADAPAIPKALLDDFLTVRKARKAGALTATAIAGIKREGAKAGLTLIEAVTYCCEVSWASFNAQWYAERTQPAAATTSRYPDKNAIPPVSTIWHESAAGVAAKAVELGISAQRDTESHPAFKRRVLAVMDIQAPGINELAAMAARRNA